MQVLSKKSLPLGGFAGLTEHRLVTDRRVFGSRKAPNTFDGIGNFVYLADAQFNPRGETHMHPHKEIDVISIMLSGRVSHEGSLEHGQSLIAGEVQVQRAGGEGFSHNEINPDSTKNRMLQLWVLPEVAGEPAGYKHYPLKANGINRIYGGKKSAGQKNQNETFSSKTTIDIVRLTAGENINFNEEILAYVSMGTADFTDENNHFSAEEGDLIRSYKTDILATSEVEIVVVGENQP
ncbi:pirin family protein [Colwellia psychrerythraea]|uniref:Pirin domain protein n=1 Tax=Colwellia psychrerythraea TaxID=28229 RepID=A0A099KT70_COLPS|nr:pirin family protein [Colwellia psychrerythraea]KGJ93037.1 Pirin domain protein [Colwellia psychrerythraea]